MSNPYEYAVYKPSGGDARVKAGRQTIYNYQGDEALYAAVDTYLVDTTWVSKMSWKNDTDTPQQYNYTYTTGLKVTNGSEVNNGFSVPASYEGMSITIDHSERVFKSTETTESGTAMIILTVPAHSLSIFYQKRYKFRDSMFFVLDAWGKDWNVGSWGGYDLSTKECDVEIMSEDHATLHSELSGTGTIAVDTVAHAEGADTTRNREKCTERCKKKLTEMRV